MIRLFMEKHILKNRALIIKEGKYFHDFMWLLMKPKNTGAEWTIEEKKQLKSHFKHLSLYMPALIIFALPLGTLLLPILTGVLDRREKDRMK
ncbi:MAG: hypothetical protein BWK74_05865 [Desulfobacteraceae bacterium A6]|nr:MAG: hypothetical protein BWK74_05865 [Desulfobacteraceae bacterium A6]